MSTGNVKLDLLLHSILDLGGNSTDEAGRLIRARYPSLSEKESGEIAQLLQSAQGQKKEERVALVATAPASFSLRAMPTKITVENMIRNASASILITGYSLSEYFSDLVDEIVLKSQRGVFVKFFVNDIERQTGLDKILRYKGRFLKVYNYPKQSDDKMAALHAKVISTDKREALITSANLSYHGQEGNLELGTHIESPAIAQQIDDVFTQLIFKKVFVEV